MSVPPGICTLPSEVTVAPVPLAFTILTTVLAVVAGAPFILSLDSTFISPPMLRATVAVSLAAMSLLTVIFFFTVP